MHTATIFDTTTREVHTLSFCIEAGTMYAALAKAEQAEKTFPGIFDSTIQGYAKRCLKEWCIITGDDPTLMGIVDARVVWSNGPSGIFSVMVQDKYSPITLHVINVAMGRDS